MKRGLLSIVCLSLLVFALAGTSYGWQGRMAGAGNPYGLLSDESDFLIHPAKIANGEGITFYGHYRFTYTDVMGWDYSLDQLTPAGVLVNVFDYETSGQEYSHNALLGAATPLGPGRFGFFFTYDGIQGNYDGDEDTLAISNFVEYDLTSDLDNFALRLLYGLPIGGFNLGGEVQFAYRQEENENAIPNFLNYPFGMAGPPSNLLPFQLPYDSSYWEALFKGSLEGMVGPLDLEFTLRGGFIFYGDNDLMITQNADSAEMDGDVTGWRIGGDLWISYPLADGLTLPFIVRLDYQEKARDGEGGPGTALWANWTERYKIEENGLRLTAGGGIDKEFGAGTTIVAGIYYNYLQGENSFKMSFLEFTPGLGNWVYDSSESPASIEHQVMLSLAGEHELSPMVALRMGLGFFYGWVQQDFDHSNNDILRSDDISLNGSHWGIEGSLGGSVQFDGFTMEPFINGGWQQIDLDGNGQRTNFGGLILNLWNMDLSRNEWYIGGGCSFLYDLP